MVSFKKSLVAVVSLAILLGLIAIVTPIRTQGHGGGNRQPPNVNVINTKSTSARVRNVAMPFSNIGFTEDIQSSVEVLRKRNRGSVVEFPSRGFRTIQEAIDAVPDGGTLKLASGLYLVNGGLFVRDKTVFFEGPGRRHGSTATLVAPRRQDTPEPCFGSSGSGRRVHQKGRAHAQYWRVSVRRSSSG